MTRRGPVFSRVGAARFRTVAGALALALALSLTTTAANARAPGKPEAPGAAEAARTGSKPGSPGQVKKAKQPTKSQAEPRGPTRPPDIRFEPTPQRAVDKMLAMADITKGDVVYDLGCGDGRIVITAAKKYGVRAVGVDIDPQRVKESRANVRKQRVGKLVTIKHADIFELDFSEADVVTLYLLPDLNVRLMPQLRKLKPGARILSYDFDMRGAIPAEVYKEDDSEGGWYTIYKWVVPWETRP